jgi:hypothetical protein
LSLELERANLPRRRQKLEGMEEGRKMVRELALLLRQREVLRQQTELIAEALARVGDEIELLRAQARTAGVVLEQDAE